MILNRVEGSRSRRVVSGRIVPVGGLMKSAIPIAEDRSGGLERENRSNQRAATVRSTVDPRSDPSDKQRSAMNEDAAGAETNVERHDFGPFGE